MEPQMGKKKRGYIESFLFGRGGPIAVLEWGSGGSTVYFPRFLKKKEKPFEWISLEYDRGWYEKLLPHVDSSSTKLVLFDVENENPRKDIPVMREYVAYPKTLGKKFDLILIDGRKRKECLLEAKELLKEDGIVLLDDAFRIRYWSAFSLFPERKFLWFSFWRGSLQRPPLWARVRDACITIFYKSWALVKRAGFPVPFD